MQPLFATKSTSREKMSLVQCSELEDKKGLGNVHNWLEYLRKVLSHITVQALSLILIMGAGCLAHQWCDCLPSTAPFGVLFPPSPFSHLNALGVVWESYHKRVLHALQKVHTRWGGMQSFFFFSCMFGFYLQCLLWLWWKDYIYMQPFYCFSFVVFKWLHDPYETIWWFAVQISPGDGPGSSQSFRPFCCMPSTLPHPLSLPLSLLLSVTIWIKQKCQKKKKKKKNHRL